LFADLDDDLWAQSRAFYSALRASFARHGTRPLRDARVLDFGCGRSLGSAGPRASPAILARSEFRPERLPFAERFDLAFAFSVFTHLSPDAHQDCLDALQRSLAPGAILVVTIRPPAWLHANERLRPLIPTLGPDVPAALERARYLFAPHPPTADHPQRHKDGEIDYGEALITMAYVRERWAPRFALLEARLLLEDPYQVMITLRRP
jgi:SAM-dependent methyltransferase